MRWLFYLAILAQTTIAYGFGLNINVRFAAPVLLQLRPYGSNVVGSRAMPKLTAKIDKIISGGQTGVDRAALDVALELGVPCGGWCPNGRLAEDGPIPDRYPLQCTESSKYSRRTRLNVQESDGTLILTNGRLAGGTALTKSYAVRELKPHLVVNLAVGNDCQAALTWLATARIQALNVAGPRASSNPEIYDQACEFLRNLLLKCKVTK